MRKFLWSDGEKQRPIHSVNWAAICIDKESGGLGVKKLLLMNTALLSKWMWRFAHEKQNLWNKVITDKYGLVAILVYGQGSARQKPFSDRMLDTVNSGVRTLFWKYKWLGQETLQATFPQILLLSMNKSGTVAEFGKTEGGQLAWNLFLRRNPKDQEIQHLGNLIQSLEQVCLQSDIDCLYWEPDRNGKFSVYNCYKMLKSQEIGPSSGVQNLCIPLKVIWDNQLPARLNFFLWEVVRNALLTRSRLSKILRNQEVEVRCPLCQLDVETQDHILLTVQYLRRSGKL